MAGVSAIAIKKSLKELGERLRQVEQPILKERLQVLYWLKQAQAPSISQIAVATVRHRGTVQKWLALYPAQGLEALLVVKPIPGGGNLCDSTVGRECLSQAIAETEQWV